MNIEEKRAVEVDKYAAIYGATTGYTMNKRRRNQSIMALSRFLDSYPDSKSLLDVGCGDGQWIQCVSDLFRLECVGVDPVPGLANHNITTAPATALPFADQSVDAVTCLDVMEHLVPEDTEYLAARDLVEGESAFKSSWVSLQWKNYPTTWN